MEVKIKVQEGRLLELHEHLKVYYSMKDMYKRLMYEVLSLESK